MRSFRVTKTAWFGPKRFIGWGWAVASWQGAVTSAIFIVLLIASVTVWKESSLIPVIVLFVLYFAIVLLTGNPPGGPRSHPRD